MLPLHSLRCWDGYSRFCYWNPDVPSIYMGSSFPSPSYSQWGYCGISVFLHDVEGICLRLVTPSEIKTVSK